MQARSARLVLEEEMKGCSESDKTVSQEKEYNVQKEFAKAMKRSVR